MSILAEKDMTQEELAKFVDLFEAFVTAAYEYYRTSGHGMPGEGHVAWIRRVAREAGDELEQLSQIAKPSAVTQVRMVRAERLIKIALAEAALFECLGMSDEDGASL